MTQISTGGYVRHRDRMVQESMHQDLLNTLIACRWLSGTTTRPVVSPYDFAAGYQFPLTTIPDQVLKLAGKREGGTPAEIVVIDYFPEAGGNNDANGESRKTLPNTLAVDTGVAQDPEFMELGSNLMAQPYVFTLAFYANSDAVALAVLGDLKDRYLGRIVTDDYLDLYNFNDPNFDDATPPITRMEVETFRYQQDAEAVQLHEVHLYFAELVLTDYVDPAYVP